jgi:hypothetical protein
VSLAITAGFNEVIMGTLKFKYSKNCFEIILVCFAVASANETIFGECAGQAQWTRLEET